MASVMKNYWVVGSTFNRSEDQKDRFLEQGVWEIDNPSDIDKQQVLDMQPEDQIAIKATFVQKYGLPFNNNEQPVSVKARGTVKSKPNDGQRVYVNWDKKFSPRDWYFFTYQKTIWQLDAKREEA
jgi:5-methylcytosine-specific restriction protein B